MAYHFFFLFFSRWTNLEFFFFGGGFYGISLQIFLLFLGYRVISSSKVDATAILSLLPFSNASIMTVTLLCAMHYHQNTYLISPWSIWFFFRLLYIRHQSRSTDLFCYDRLSTSILHTLFLIFYYFKRYIYWIRVFEFVYLTLVNLLSLSFHSLEKVELRTLLLFTFTYLFICFFPWFNHFLFSMPRSPYLPTLFTFPIRKQFFFFFLWINGFDS